MELNPYQMENLAQKPGRRHGSKNLNNRPPAEKAEVVFNEVFKTFKTDLTQLSPAERINAAIQLAGYFLTPKTKSKNE